MTVAELIEWLQRQDPTLPVVIPAECPCCFADVDEVYPARRGIGHRGGIADENVVAIE